MSAAAALVVAAALAGCGSTTYFAGRTLPPSGIANRVMIAIQNPGSLSKGALEVVDAYYDTRYAYNNINKNYSISGFSGGLPSSIQSMPNEQVGVVYGSGDGSLALINYAKESSASAASLSGLSTSVFMTRDQNYVFATSQGAHTLTVVDKTTTNGGTYTLSAREELYRVSVNPSGSVALIFAQNSNHMYYPRKLNAQQTIDYSTGPSSWPKAAVDCEPKTSPGWCLFEAESPDAKDSTGNYYGTPLNFDMPVKAIFSADGGSAYVLSCGPECGGSKASVTSISIAPMIYLIGQSSGTLPTQTALSSNTLALPGGASNALLDSSTLYVVGQEKMKDGYWGGQLSIVNLPSGSTTVMTKSVQMAISDGAQGAVSRMILADNNTLWIGMTGCLNGERYNNPSIYGTTYGCLTMLNTSTHKATLLPYIGDATGIAAVTGLHKIYTAEGGQVYIYSTVDGTEINNEYVTVTGTAYDVTYMDATVDTNNTVY
jgi:hypothetical protein